MTNRATPFHSWLDFTRALELEFGPSPYECSRSQLFKLVQLHTVQDYYNQFTTLANRVQGVTTEALIDCFVGGLKPDIQRDVIAQSPTTLLRCVSLAKLYEEKYNTKPKSVFQQNPTRASYATNHNTSSQSLRSTNLPPLLQTPLPTSHHNISKSTPVKRMSPMEMQLRREKGLCYTCDEKFTASHNCPNKQYLLFYMDGDDETDQPPPIDAEDVTHLEDQTLSYNALKGSSGYGTIKFKGIINGLEIHILLDSGSSDNFLQPCIANHLKLPRTVAPNFQVLVGNGHSLVAEGLVNQLEVSVQGYMLTIPVYILPISGADLVLGAAWLATLGPHIADYSTRTLKFYSDNKFVTLQGEHPQLPSHAEFHQLRRIHNTHAIEQLFTMQHIP